MNHTKRRALLYVLVLIALVPLSLFPGAAGSASAASTESGWQSLSEGESLWYNLSYARDGSQVEIRLQVSPEGSAGLAVWTPEQVQSLSEGDSVKPIGRGSADAKDPATLLWSGNFGTAGTYSIVVERAANQKGTSYYSLQVSGTGVTPWTAEGSQAVPANGETTASTARSASQPKTALASQLTGKLVFQTSFGGPFYTINVDGSGLQSITNGIDPVWSPDGSQIAFVRWDDPRGVWVVNADVRAGGSGERRIFDTNQARYPSWSPDGQEIVFSQAKSGGGGGPGGPPPGSGFAQPASVAFRGPGGPPGGGSAGSSYTLGVVSPADGTFYEPLPVSDTNLTPDWSPDGLSIVFAGLRGLMVASVDARAGGTGAGDQQSYQLTSDATDTSPVWSPDGSRVAFVRRQHDHWEIYVVDVSGENAGQVRRLTDTPALPDGTAGDSVSPAWSPASPDGDTGGKYLAFLTNRSGEWQIWVMNADGTGSAQAGPLFDTELDKLTLSYAYAGERAIDWAK